MNLQINLDIVIIRVNGQVYQDTPENLEADYGAPIPSVPEGYDMTFYEPGSKYEHASRDRADPVLPAEWPAGDSILAAFDSIVSAKAERLTQPEKTGAELMADSMREIDAKAGSVRTRFVTSTAGQEATYLIKERQAREYAAGGYSGDVPAMVAAKAAASGLSAQQAADLIITTADAWILLAAAIEQVREGGKAAVAAAGNDPAVVAARDAALAALDAIRP